MDTTILNNNQSNFFVQKQIEVMIDLNNKQIAAEFKLIQGMINQLKTELAHLSSKMNGARIEEPVISAPVVESQQVLKPKPTEAAKPRYGDYKPGDVDIETFFYCGKR